MNIYACDTHGCPFHKESKCYHPEAKMIERKPGKIPKDCPLVEPITIKPPKLCRECNTPIVEQGNHLMHLECRREAHLEQMRNWYQANRETELERARIKYRKQKNEKTAKIL